MKLNLCVYLSLMINCTCNSIDDRNHAIHRSLYRVIRDLLSLGVEQIWQAMSWLFRKVGWSVYVRFFHHGLAPSSLSTVDNICYYYYYYVFFSLVVIFFSWLISLYFLFQVSFSFLGQLFFGQVFLLLVSIYGMKD